MGFMYDSKVISRHLRNANLTARKQIPPSCQPKMRSAFNQNPCDLNTQVQPRLLRAIFASIYALRSSQDEHLRHDGALYGRGHIIIVKCSGKSLASENLPVPPEDFLALIISLTWRMQECRNAPRNFFLTWPRRVMQQKPLLADARKIICSVRYSSRSALLTWAWYEQGACCSCWRCFTMYWAFYWIIPKHAESLLVHIPEGYDPVIVNGTGVWLGYDWGMFKEYYSGHFNLTVGGEDPLFN